MTSFIAVKALGGFNYVRASQVMAVATAEQIKCNIYMVGGVTVPCSEPAKDVVARLDAAEGAVTVPAPETEPT
jgi:hypothetical protein